MSYVPDPSQRQCQAAIPSGADICGALDELASGIPEVVPDQNITLALLIGGDDPNGLYFDLKLAGYRVGGEAMDLLA